MNNEDLVHNRHQVCGSLTATPGVLVGKSPDHRYGT